MDRMAIQQGLISVSFGLYDMLSTEASVSGLRRLVKH